MSATDRWIADDEEDAPPRHETMICVSRLSCALVTLLLSLLLCAADSSFFFYPGINHLASLFYPGIDSPSRHRCCNGMRADREREREREVREENKYTGPKNC